MKPRALLTSAGVICAATGVLHAEPFRKGPYLQNVTSTGVTVMWEASRSRACTVELTGMTPARTIAVEPADEGGDIFEVPVTGLEPGKRYGYVVDCGGQREPGEFATAPASGEPFTFVVYGDTRSNAGSHRQVVERIRREVPDILLGTGDMVDEGAKEKQWQEFFDIERELLRENVLFPSVGNHDRQGRGRTADNYRTFFSLPENSPDPERYYAFTYGNARFVVLDSNAYSFSLTDQTEWLEHELQAAELDPAIEHVFVTMHHPPFSISLHGGQRELRERWTPLFEKYRVSAVFSGHDHVYSRAERNNVRYYVSGGGGAPLYPRSRRPSQIDVEAVKYFERVNHYLRVHVIGNLVEVTAIRSDGSIIETASWGSLPAPRRNTTVSQASAVPGKEAGNPARAAGAGQPDRPAEQLAPGEVRAASLAGSAGGAAEGGRFGILGQLGAVLIVVAGAVLIWTLRG